MIELRGVEKSFGETPVLCGVDLAISEGDTAVLIGPSGCGKSTLLRLVLGLTAPDAGKVIFAGEPLTEENLLAVRRRTGYVIQDGGLFPHLPARENVALLPRHLGWSESRIGQRVEELCELTRMTRETLDRHPGRLSGGQRQRVALMRALACDPEVLLLDEPLAALDPLVRAELQDELAAVFSRLGKTVLLVTHDLAEAGFFAEDIVLLREGRVAQRGSSRTLVEEPADDFVARFVRAQRR